MRKDRPQSDVFAQRRREGGLSRPRERYRLGAIRQQAELWSVAEVSNGAYSGVFYRLVRLIGTVTFCDAIGGQSNMGRVMRVVVFLCCVLSPGCATFQTEHEHVYFSQGEPNESKPAWKVGYSAKVPNQRFITELIREGDDINNWNELLTIDNFPPLWGGPSPEDALNQLKLVREMRCPGVTKWNVISKDEKSILYEWQARPCLGWPDQHQITKIIYGKYNTFILSYVQKNYQMPDEERSKWIKRFSEARIEIRLQW